MGATMLIVRYDVYFSNFYIIFISININMQPGGTMAAAADAQRDRRRNMKSFLKIKSGIRRGQMRFSIARSVRSDRGPKVHKNVLISLTILVTSDMSWQRERIELHPARFHSQFTAIDWQNDSLNDDLSIWYFGFVHARQGGLQ